MADETTTTSMNDVIGTEFIPNYIKSYNYPVLVGAQVAQRIEAPEGSTPIRLAQFNQISVPAGTVTQAADMTRVSVTADNDTVTPGVVGLELAITDQLVRGSRVNGIAVQTIDQAIMALMARRDSDILSAITSASTTYSNTATALGRDVAKRALITYGSQLGQNAMLPAFLLSTAAYEDLSIDELLSTATSAMFAAMFSPMAGFKGEWHGALIFVSNQMPANAPGYSSAITPIGQLSGLGLGVVEDLNVEINRGAEGARGRKSFAAISTWFAAGLAADPNILEVASAA